MSSTDAVTDGSILTMYVHMRQSHSGMLIKLIGMLGVSSQFVLYSHKDNNKPWRSHIGVGHSGLAELEQLHAVSMVNMLISQHTASVESRARMGMRLHRYV